MADNFKNKLLQIFILIYLLLQLGFGTNIASTIFAKPHLSL